MDDPRQPHQRGVATQIELFNKSLETALGAAVRELRAGRVKGVRALLLSDGQDLVGRDVEDLCLRVDEFPNQPGTGDAIRLRPRACDPLHDWSSDVVTDGVLDHKPEYVEMPGWWRVRRKVRRERDSNPRAVGGPAGS